ncbi:DUF7563 family protein [Haladaptatus sp.]|uniref:DUF7563 family protein n=1 Tax=Haladaptatus sp. TaxID=1973141 RepID=UPI003C70363E
MPQTTAPTQTGSRIADTRCQSCGNFVTPDFAHVFGDNQNSVHGCLNCMDGTAVKNGQAVD